MSEFASPVVPQDPIGADGPHAGFALEARSTSARLVAAVVAAATLGVAATNYFAFSSPDSFAWQLHAASGGWLNPNLTLFLPLSVLVVGGLIMAGGRLRLANLGLAPGWALRLCLVLLVGWAMVQVLALLAAVLSGMPVEAHPAWSEPGAGTVLGLLVAMVLGTALFEEAVFRGYLLPQLHFALKSLIASERARLVAAWLLAAAIFALWHLPTILLNGGGGGAGAVLGALAYMMLGGVMLGLLYLRTARLEVAIAGHALVNAPTLLVASPVSGSLLAGLVGLAAIVAGPVLAGRSFSLALARPVPS